MTESEFNTLIDDTLVRIEDTLDEEAESDMDYVTVGGVLTILCENGSQVIFTRQAPVLQLWMATPEGGFHFDYDSEHQSWLRDSDGEPLGPFLQKVLSKQAGELFEFKL